MTTPYLAQQAQELEWIGGSTVRVLLDSAATGGQLMVMHSVLQRGDGAPLHVHGREDEVFLLLQGAATFWVGDQRQQLTDGGTAWLPRELAHTYRADADDTHLLTICTPGGLEGFFRAAGRDRALPPPEGWTLTPQTMAAAIQDHGGRVVGPPKSLAD
jgi:quercetin dioxygenase-like cupin family protein